MDQIPEVQCSAEPETLMALSRLFAYPKQWPHDRDLARILRRQGRSLPAPL